MGVRSPLGSVCRAHTRNLGCCARGQRGRHANAPMPRRKARRLAMGILFWLDLLMLVWFCIGCLFLPSACARAHTQNLGSKFT